MEKLLVLASATWPGQCPFRIISVGGTTVVRVRHYECQKHYDRLAEISEARKFVSNVGALARLAYDYNYWSQPRGQTYRLDWALGEA